MSSTKILPPTSIPRLPPVMAAYLPGLLQRLDPPVNVIHIGVGQGIGAMHEWRDWNVAHAVIADTVVAPWVAAALARCQGWSNCAMMVAASVGTGMWYDASNPAESGAFPPEDLLSIWPQLKTRQAEVCNTTTIDVLVTQHLPLWQNTTAGNWLLIDCMPALPILQGAEHTLTNCSVIWLRVVLESTLPELEEAKYEALSCWLAERGFTPLAAIDGLNPAIGEAVFIKTRADFFSQDESPHSRKRCDVFARDNEALTTACAVDATAEMEALARCSILELEKNELIAALDARKNDGLALLQAEAKGRQEILAKRDALARERAELRAALDAETKERQKLLAQRDELTREKAELGSLLDAGARANLEILANRDALAREYAQLCEESVKEKALLLSELQQETTAKNDAIAKLQEERKAHMALLTKIDSLTEENHALTVSRDHEIRYKLEAIAKRDAIAIDRATVATEKDNFEMALADAIARCETLIAENVEVKRASEAGLIEKSQLLARMTADAIAAAEVQALVESLKIENEMLIVERDVDRHASAAAIANRDAEARAKEEALAQRDVLVRENSAIIASREEQIKLGLERQQQIVTGQEETQNLRNILGQLEAENDENKLRQRVMQDELVRAEAQIELIKDLLLREPSL